MKKFRLTSLFKITLPVLLVTAAAAVTGPILVSCSNNKTPFAPVQPTPNYNDEQTFLKTAKALHLTTMPIPSYVSMTDNGAAASLKINFTKAQKFANQEYYLPNSIAYFDFNNRPNIAQFKNTFEFFNYISLSGIKYYPLKNPNPIINANKDLLEYNDEQDCYEMIRSLAYSECWEKYQDKLSYSKVEWVKSWKLKGYDWIEHNDLVYKISGFKVSYWRDGKYIENEIINPNIGVYCSVFEDDYNNGNQEYYSSLVYKMYFEKYIDKYPAVFNNELWSYQCKL